MVPRGERSIRDIPIPSNHRRPAAPLEKDEEELPEEPAEKPRRRTRRKGPGRRFWALALGIVVGCAALAFFVSTMFAGASVTVYPRMETISNAGTLQASLNASTGSLAYESMTVRRSATTEAAASGTSQVSRQASGVITVYNAYSETPQRLIANTRFEATDGKIYRIRESASVPGATKNTDGSLKAGTITVTVYADSPGADYNRDESARFTVPGFKGDPRYEKFYAESQGAISGGFVGTEPTVPAAEMAKAEAALKLELDTAVRAGAEAEVPTGYSVIGGTLTISYSDIRKVTEGNKAELSQSAIATVSMVRQDSLASALARASLGGSYGGEPVVLENAKEVTISAATATSTTGVLSLSVSGAPSLVWQFDPALLQQALQGKDRESLSTIIEPFKPAVVQATASIRPFWKSAFPSDPAKIRITVSKEAVSR